MYANAFFHLFSWEEQVMALGKAVLLLKPRKGGFVFGKQTGTPQAGEIEWTDSRSGRMWRHDEKSFRMMVDEVAKNTGRDLVAEVEVGDTPHAFDKSWTRITFCVTIR